MSKVEDLKIISEEILSMRLRELIETHCLKNFICIDGPKAYEISIPKKEPFEGMELKVFIIKENPDQNDIVPLIVNYVLKYVFVDYEKIWFWQYTSKNIS
jgi:hypothetical protein